MVRYRSRGREGEHADKMVDDVYAEYGDLGVVFGERVILVEGTYTKVLLSPFMDEVSSSNFSELDSGSVSSSSLSSGSCSRGAERVFS